MSTPTIYARHVTPSPLGATRPPNGRPFHAYRDFDRISRRGTRDDADIYQRASKNVHGCAAHAFRTPVTMILEKRPKQV